MPRRARQTSSEALPSHERCARSRPARGRRVFPAPRHDHDGECASQRRTFVGPARAPCESRPVAEGGHYTFVEAQTDQIGESRLDKNVKKFFVSLHRLADPRHALEAGY